MYLPFPPQAVSGASEGADDDDDGDVHVFTQLSTRT